MSRTVLQLKDDLSTVRSRMICIQDEMKMRHNEYVELLAQEVSLEVELKERSLPDEW